MRWFFLLACLSFCLHAADFYVDNTVGNDDFDGLAKAPGADGVGPKATITAALKAAGAGDTVHINPTGKLYRQMADFYGHPGGEEAKPLTLDGHGVMLSGADPCPKDGWGPYAGDTLQRTTCIPRVYIMLDGEMVHTTHSFNVLEPGEFCYHPYGGNRLYFRAPEGTKHGDHIVEVGQPDGTSVTLDGSKWGRSHSKIGSVYRYGGLKKPTWVKLNGEEVPLVEARDRLQSGDWTVHDDVFYFNPPADRALADLEILCPVRGNGVAMNGETKYVVCRNLNVKHVYNDGYNIHGRVTNVEFYNCNARDVGDEGFSAHGQCETLLDGAVYVNCDNGIANVNTGGWSITRNVVLARARSVGFLIHNTARHEITNAILVDNPNQFSVNNTKADNLLIVGTGDVRTQGMNIGPDCEVRRATVLGNNGLLRVNKDSSLLLVDAVLGPGQGVIHARTDDPAPLLTLQDVIFTPGQILQWNAKYPWQEQPLAEWIAGPGADRATDCRAVEFTGLENAPEGGGCTPELIARYRKWLATGE